MPSEACACVACVLAIALVIALVMARAARANVGVCACPQTGVATTLTLPAHEGSEGSESSSNRSIWSSGTYFLTPSARASSV